MEDGEMDPEMAAMMGFSSFGGSKKRKHYNDTFVEGQTGAKRPTNKAAGTGANMTELGIRRKSVDDAPTDTENAEEVAHPANNASSANQISHQLPQNPTTSTLPPHSSLPAKPAAASAQHDIAYYLPSFVEDPWSEFFKAQA